ncbi:NB-ARC - like 10, partial [Theobroma cacao]
MEYARTVVKHCGGLPLALQVLGSSLFSKSINVWKSALKELKAIPDSKIQKILRISYDSLQDDHDKNLFLDIACVFVGKNRDYTTTILDGCDYCTAIALNISKLVVLKMHNSNLKCVWNDTKCFLPNLKILNLSHSHGLLKIFNLSGLHSLQSFMLKDCIKLIEVDQSLGEIKTLTILNLKGCKSLRKLPRTIGSLEFLEELFLSCCSTLDDVPRDLQNMKS